MANVLDFYNRFATCLNSIEEPRLLQAIDAQWKGFLDYSSTLGGPEDPWYRCEERGVWPPKNTHSIKLAISNNFILISAMVWEQLHNSGNSLKISLILKFVTFDKPSKLKYFKILKESHI